MTTPADLIMRRIPLDTLLTALHAGGVEVVDLSHALSEATPTIELPPPLRNTPGFRLRRLSRYDDDGPAWHWNAIESGEHVGTHFDAPIHWVTGRDREDVAAVAPGRLVAPAVVLDITEEAEADPDHLVEVEHIEAFCAVHGPLPEGGWLLLRTGWDARHDDHDAFLNADDLGPHWPGVSPQCARWLAQESPLQGLGTETVGIDAGQAQNFSPPFPAHHWMLGAGKYGLASLANLAALPPTGAILVAAPLKIAGGSGSSARVLAFVPSA